MPNLLLKFSISLSLLSFILAIFSFRKISKSFTNDWLSFIRILLDFLYRHTSISDFNSFISFDIDTNSLKILFAFFLFNSNRWVAESTSASTTSNIPSISWENSFILLFSVLLILSFISDTYFSKLSLFFLKNSFFSFISVWCSSPSFFIFSNSFKRSTRWFLIESTIRLIVLDEWLRCSIAKQFLHTNSKQSSQ